MLENGLLQPGQTLYFGVQGAQRAVVLANGHLRWSGQTGSIHQIGSLIRGSACNGWDHWFYDDGSSGKRQTVDQLRQRLQRSGLEQALMRIELAVRPGDRRCLDHDFPSIDIDSALKQAMILHRRAITLHKELMDAERALAENDSESNLAVIRDLQLQLSALDGMEADRDRLNVVASVGSDQGLATA